MNPFKVWAVLLSLQLSIASAGTVSTSSAAPATDLISSIAAGSIDTGLFDETVNANHARGQLFSLPNGAESAFEITAVTVRKSSTQTYANDTLTLRFFEGTQGQWGSGTGHSRSVDGDDYYVDTTVTSLHSETFLLNGAITDNDYVTFELETPITVSEDSDFGFLMTYDRSDSANPGDFRHREGGAGGRLSISITGHSTSSRNVVYFVQGSPSGGGGGNEPELELGSPFQDRMILQRDKPVKIWGTTDPASMLEVVINGLTVTGTADAEGNWEVDLPASTAGGPHTLNVTSTSEGGMASTTINDVLFGDVWFCFGQSNMRWRFSNLPGAVTWDDFYRTEIAANDNIRCLSVVENGSLDEEETTEMTWLANSSVASWTVVGSVFAHQLNAATGVPVGIIYCGYGSSSIEGWLPDSLAADLPHYGEMLEHYQSISEFRDGVLVADRVTDGRVPGNFTTNEEAIASVSATNLAAGSQSDIFMRTRPNVLYNRRIHPLRKFGLAGFIWYQGEANSVDPLDVAQHQFTLPLMVEEYRERFGQGELPFIGVQLPSFNEDLWPFFRESQDSLLEVNNAYVAVTIDTGETNNIHPSDKEEIGARLSLLAREHVLGEAIESDSPRYASHTINGNQVTLTFDHASGLATDNGAAPAGFQVAGSDQIFHAANASISGNTIIVSSAAEPAPVAVRYAWTATTHTFVNVINDAAQPNGASGSPLGDGLPLAPFRTDDWPLAGLTAQSPFGVDDVYTVSRDQVLTIPANGVLANDFDLNQDPLSAVLITDVSFGTLALMLDGSFSYTPDAGYAGPDQFVYRSTDGSLISEETTVSITVSGQQTNYFLWSVGISWGAGDDETPTGDPDQDGIVNFLEFALGLNPLVQDVSGLPSLSAVGDDFSYDFNNVQPGVTYEVQLSTDLVTWSDPAFATVTSGDSTPITIPAANAADGKLFVRLRVSE